MKSKFRTPNSELRIGFTLVELLVVITIIAILAALLIPAVMAAQRRARLAQIKIEVDQLALALEDYKNDNGEYPPNALAINQNQFVRHFKKAFPRHQEPDKLIRRLAGATNQIATSGQGDGGGAALPGGITAAEAVVFWLAGFSNDPKYPISGPGGPAFTAGEVDPIESRDRTFDFDLARLGMGETVGIGPTIDAGSIRSINYSVVVNGNPQDKQINLWQYYPPKSTKPFVYFDASRSIPEVAEDVVYHDMLDVAGLTHIEHVVPVKVLSNTPADPANPKVKDLNFANKGKFQILHPGVDDDWGEGFHEMEIDFRASNEETLLTDLEVALYPTGPFTGGLADTVINFDERILGDTTP